MGSLLYFDVSCLASNGNEVCKLRVVSPATHTVKQLIDKIHSHTENPGEWERLRVQGSEVYLLPEERLHDVLRPHERYLEAVPPKSIQVMSVRNAYTANEKFRNDKSFTYLSCEVGDKMVTLEKANGWVKCINAEGIEGFLPEYVFDSDPEPPREASPERSKPRPGLAVVDRITTMTSGYVDSMIFHMHDGQQYHYGKGGGHRPSDVMLSKDEVILSATQIEKQSLGEIVLTTSARELVFKGYFGPGKKFERHVFHCQPGYQIHHLEIEDSVLVGTQQVPIDTRDSQRSRRRGSKPPRANGRLTLRSRSRDSNGG